MACNLLLVLQFDSARKTFINLAVLPFALVGVTIGLLLFGSYFGFITLLAIISLFGIVLNNGNVLLDRIGIELEEGREPRGAVVEASVRLLRPILLTTATTRAPDNHPGPSSDRQWPIPSTSSSSVSCATSLPAERRGDAHEFGGGPYDREAHPGAPHLGDHGPLG